jgi:hypothetical protein
MPVLTLPAVSRFTGTTHYRTRITAVGTADHGQQRPLLSLSTSATCAPSTKRRHNGTTAQQQLHSTQHAVATSGFRLFRNYWHPSWARLRDHESTLMSDLSARVARGYTCTAPDGCTLASEQSPNSNTQALFCKRTSHRARGASQRISPSILHATLMVVSSRHA